MCMTTRERGCQPREISEVRRGSQAVPMSAVVLWRTSAAS